MTQGEKGTAGFPYRRLVAPGIFVGIIALVFFLRGVPKPASDDDRLTTFTGATMGTTFTVKVVAPGLDEASTAVIERTIRTAVDDVDFAMSTYKPQSELSRFNAAGTKPVHVSKALGFVVATAIKVGRESGGALDITVGPLVDAWGFGPEEAPEPPDAEQIAELMPRVGLDKLTFDAADSTLKKSVAGLHVDLSAVAKGYAVDHVVQALGNLGYHDDMVEIGGEIRTAGINQDGLPWVLGIERPDSIGRSVEVSVEASNRALATSGDYRNFRMIDGKRVSHTIDPRTGRPIDHNLASVSVLAPSCIEADAWATALDVLGPVEGRALAEQKGVAALFLIRGAEGFEIARTTTFPKKGVVN